MIRALIKTAREYNKQIKELNESWSQKGCNYKDLQEKNKLIEILKKHKQMKPFNIDLKASDKGERKKAVKYLRDLGYTVKKRKDEAIMNLCYLTNIETSCVYTPKFDFEYYVYFREEWGETLILPRDWDKLIEYTKRDEPKYKNGSYYWVNDGGAWKPAQKGDNVWHFMHYAAREEDVREVGEEIKRNK